MNRKEIEDKVRTEVYKAISEMLDNPDKLGIYPTTKCYNRLEKYFTDFIMKRKLFDWETPCKANIKTIHKLEDQVYDLKKRERSLVEALRPFAEELDIQRGATGEPDEEEDLWDHRLGKHLFVKASKTLKSLGYSEREGK